VRKPLAVGLVVAVLSAGASAASARVAGSAAAPSVKITYPSHCACGIVAPQPSTVSVIVEVTNFKLSAADFGKAPVKGEGHLLFQLDHGKFDRPPYSGANGKLAAKIGVVGKYSPSVTPKITYTNLPSGKHTVVVYLVSNDNKKLGPSDKLAFPVQ
jgi:hypothetical protein